MKKTPFNETDDFAKTLYRYVKLDHSQRVRQKIRAKELSLLADWKILIENYEKFNI